MNLGSLLSGLGNYGGGLGMSGLGGAGGGSLQNEMAVQQASALTSQVSSSLPPSLAQSLDLGDMLMVGANSPSSNPTNPMSSALQEAEQFFSSPSIGASSNMGGLGSLLGGGGLGSMMG